ncbi:MAG: helix-turn-helix domain-containing protein [Candidatus Limnocylindria bacterium]
MALRLIRICSVAAILVMGLMVHDTTAAAAHESLPVAYDFGPGELPDITVGAAPPDAPVPAELPQPEASAEPAPTGAPAAEASTEPAPSEVPESEASTEPAPTEVTEPEASAEPAPSEIPESEASADPEDPDPTDMPQAEASVEPTPTVEPAADAIIELTSDVAVPEASQEPAPDLATDALVLPQPPTGAGASHVDNAATADAHLDTHDAAERQPSGSTFMAAAPTPTIATPGDAAPSAGSTAVPRAVSTEWASIDAPGAPRAATIPVLDAVEPVSAGAGVVAGIAATNRAPAVAVAMEFGRAGSGWAGAIVFNLWLRRQMRERRMSQRQLAVLSGVNHSTISRLIHQDRHPSLETATKLAKALRKAGGELDTADYFDRLPEETLFPARRVELALRGDELLDDEDVDRLMRSYLRARESRRGVPARVVIDVSSSSDAEAPR